MMFQYLCHPQHFVESIWTINGNDTNNKQHRIIFIHRVSSLPQSQNRFSLIARHDIYSIQHFSFIENIMYGLSHIMFYCFGRMNNKIDLGIKKNCFRVPEVRKLCHVEFNYDPEYITDLHIEA